MRGGKIVVDTELKTKTFEKQIEQVEKELDELVKRRDKAQQQLTENKTQKINGNTYMIDTKKIQKDISQYNLQIERTTNKLNDLNSKQEQINNEGFNQLTNDLKSAEKSAGKFIKKLSKMALGIFSIRSAFMFVRQSVSTLSQYNDDLKNDIEGIRYVLASSLLPIIQTVVNWVKILLSYLNYIYKSWTGKDLFDMTNYNLKKANGQAKELKRTLAGFDEMNVLSDSSSSSSSSDNFDFKLPDSEKPWWVQWIAENKDSFLNFLKLIASFIALFKLAELITSLDTIFKLTDKIGGALKKVLDFLGTKTGTGLLFIVGGLVLLIKGLIDYLNDPTWENFIVILGGIALIVAGLFVAFGTTVGWIGLIVLAIGAVGVAVYKNWDKIKAVLSPIWNWIDTKVLKPTWNGVKWLINGVISMLNGLIKGINEIAYPLRALIVGIGKVSGKSWTMDSVQIPMIPKLAKGGILNMPGKGVPYGGATIAERGPEAILPLTDNQQMEMLGSKIAEYVKIHITNVTELDGKVTSRKIKTVSANNDFAMNN